MRFPKRISRWLIILPGLVLAVMVRLALFDYESTDYVGALSVWYEYIKSHGGIYALKYKFYDYPPSYIYLMLLATYIPIKSLYSIKMISVFFDFIAAITISRIIKLKYENPIITMISFFIVIFHPTVLLNGSLWGQCDVIFTSFCLLSIYHMLKKKYWFSILYFSIAFSFKLQSLFLVLPFAILFIYRVIRTRHFLSIPAVYFLSIIPCWIMGRSLWNLLKIYWSQGNRYQSLTLNAPNVYQFVGRGPFEIFDLAGIAATLFVIYFFTVLFMERKQELSKEFLVKVSMISVLLVPYLLPRMHERYFFLADLVSVVYAFYFPKYFFVPLVVGAISAFCYTNVLFSAAVLDFRTMAIAMGAITALVAWDLLRDLMEAYRSSADLNRCRETSGQ